MENITTEALKALLEEIRRRDLIEAAEAGAKLHNEKNAPWVSGQYTHLAGKFPPYVYREFPKMLYGVGYLEACELLERVEREFVRKDEQQDHEARIEHARRMKASFTRTVRDEGEQAGLGVYWVEKPSDLKTAKQRLEDDVALASAESNFDDRNMSESAKAEREALEDQANDFVTEVPAANKRGRRPVPAAAAV